MTFQGSPVYSSTFQAYANPVYISCCCYTEIEQLRLLFKHNLITFLKVLNPHWTIVWQGKSNQNSGYQQHHALLNNILYMYFHCRKSLFFVGNRVHSFNLSTLFSSLLIREKAAQWLSGTVLDSVEGSRLTRTTALCP